MKIVAGHKYIKCANGEIFPFGEIMFKAAGEGATVFIAEAEIKNEKQLPENEAIKPSSVAHAKEMLAPRPTFDKPKPQPKLVHQDITAEMKQDLSELK